MGVNCRSTGVATAEAIVSGGGAGSEAATRTGGKGGRHLDGGEIHVGQIAHGQVAVGLDAEEQDPGHHQRGHDRTLDERLGDVHVPLPAAPPFTCTFVPGESRSCPSVTTTSPGLSPLSITASFSSELPTVTARDSTVPSCFTTKAYCPCWPRWMATAGATTASCCSPSFKVTRTY